ncbi:F-box only protein 50 [Paramormyrops kingsleyae]|uniref:P1, F-box associated domain containing n=1 Tax=Paramormyrops kingsleyae TaxID=1676925 RepID=A0A3B3Q6D1_9TELE|nr:F-box only protein 50 [Paramormyrops kingsleyae]
MAANDWKQKYGSELKLEENKLPMPDTVDWKSVYEKKPLGRNLLKNPSPFGLDHETPPPERELAGMFGAEPPRFEPEGDFSNWTKSNETLPYDTSGIPAGAVICHLPQFSWFTLEQKVDLKAEGFWDELLDDFQPDIAIEDWYEQSQIREPVYVLKVTLLGADGQTVIKEHVFTPEGGQSNDSHTWKQVTHVFSSYGPGVRQVHFLHKMKNMNMVQFHATRVTGSSVIVRPTRSTTH